MSYKCGVCCRPTPDGSTRLIHRVVRERVNPLGVVMTECAAEVPVCADCKRSLDDGATLAELRLAKAPKREDVAAPVYVPGETRTVTVGDALVVPEHHLAKPDAPSPEHALPEVGLLYSLFARYGALAYWEPRFAEMTAEAVGNEVAQHFHLRRLWGKLHDLVPASRKRKCRRPQPSIAAHKPRSIEDEVPPERVDTRTPRAKRSKQ